MVCPYNWNSPGGVRSHIQGLTSALNDRGHHVELLTPTDDSDLLPDYATYGGKPVNVSYNGSVAGLTFGVGATRRVRSWIRQGNFDVLHVHEPLAPSLSILACWAARGPIVGTWHLSTERSRTLSAAYGLAQTALEKLSARIAVSEDARRTLVSHVGGDAVLIPNGVRLSEFTLSKPQRNSRPTALFLGRLDEPRKGFDVVVRALPELVALVPDVVVKVAGPGDLDQIKSRIPGHLHRNVEFLGWIDDVAKAEAFASSDVYMAPHLGGESFGIVLIEALAAGTAVVASDLPAFRRVLQDGRCGVLVPRDNPTLLANATAELLLDEVSRRDIQERGHLRAGDFDWDYVVGDVLAVYDAVRTPGEVVVEDFRGQWMGRLSGRPR
jgi:phosphatidyl-myo-inositol alpha-mannosyltransferase